MIFQGVLSNE